jgi:hypothetical protein
VWWSSRQSSFLAERRKDEEEVGVGLTDAKERGGGGLDDARRGGEAVGVWHGLEQRSACDWRRQEPGHDGGGSHCASRGGRAYDAWARGHCTGMGRFDLIPIQIQT